MRWKPIIAALCLIAAVICFVWSAHLFRVDVTPTPPYDTPAQLMLAGAFLLFAAMLLSDKREKVSVPRDVPMQPSRTAWRWVVVGGVLLALEGEISGGALKVPLFQGGVSIHLQYLIWFVGVVLITYGMGGAPRLRVPRYEWKAFFPLCLILLLAFALRVIGLDTTIRQSLDEVHWMDGVRFVYWSRDAYPLLQQPSGFQGATAIYTYWNTGTVMLFGWNWVGLRIINAIIGTLTVFVMYGLGRALFNTRFGLIAALVLATFPPHVHFSRLSLAHITDAFIGAALIMFVVRGLRYGRRLDWALAGTMLGLGNYFFESGRLLFPVFTVAWFILLALFVPKARRHWRGMLVALTVGVLMALPVYYNLIVHGSLANNSRILESGGVVTEWLPLLQDGFQFNDVLNMLRLALTPFLFLISVHERGDYWGGAFGLMYPGVIPFFFLGVFYCLGRWRSVLNAFPLYILLVGFGNALLTNKWGSPRYVIVLPVLSLMITVGIWYALALLEPGKRWSSFRRHREQVSYRTPSWWRWRTVLLVIITVVVVLHPLYYFTEHLRILNNRLLDSRPYPDMFDAAIRAATLYDPTKTDVFIISRFIADANVARGVYSFYTNGVSMGMTSAAAADITQAWIDQLPRDRNYLFMVEPGLNDLVALLTANFPNMYPPQISHYDLPADRNFVAYYAPLSSSG